MFLCYELQVHNFIICDQFQIKFTIVLCVYNRGHLEYHQQECLRFQYVQLLHLLNNWESILNETVCMNKSVAFKSNNCSINTTTCILKNNAVLCINMACIKSVETGKYIYVVRHHESHIMSEKKYFSFWQIWILQILSFKSIYNLPYFIVRKIHKKMIES